MRRGIFAAAFFALCISAWGVDYYWIGSAGNNDWNDAGNWSEDSSGTPAATSAPGTSDTAIFTADGNLSYIFSQDIDVDSIRIRGKREITFDANKITVKNFYYEPRELDWDNKLIITNSGGTNSLGNFVANTNTGNAQVEFSCKNTFDSFTSNIMRQIDFTQKNTFNGDVSITGGTKVTLNKANTFNGGFTFEKGNSLIVNDEQTFNGTLSLTGTSTSNRLEINGNGNGKIVISSDQVGSYLNIKDSIEVSGGTFYAANSEVESGVTANGWNVYSGGIDYTWVGATNSEWSNAANWNTGSVPGTDAASRYGDVTIPSGCSNYPIAAAAYTVAKVSIQSGASLELASGANLTATIENNGTLKTSTNYSLGTYSGGGTIENSAALTIDAASVTVENLVNSGTVNNNSAALTLKDYSGSGKIVIASGAKLITDLASNKTIAEIENSGTVQNDNSGALAITTLTMVGDCSVINNVADKGNSSRHIGQITIGILSGSDTAALQSRNGQNIIVNSYSGVPSLYAKGINILLGSGTIYSLNVENITGLIGDLTISSDLTLNDNARVISYDGGTIHSIVLGGDLKNLNSNGYLGYNDDNYKISSFTVTSTNATIQGGINIVADNFIYSPSTASGAKLTLSGNNIFQTFTASDLGGATLDISDTQKVGTTLSLSGSSSNVLTIEGSGKFAIPANQTGAYLNIKKSGVEICNTAGASLASDAYNFKALASSYDTAPLVGIEKGWNVIGDTITWTGASSTAWALAANWDVGIVPGVSGSGISDTTGYNVVIPAVASSNNPVAAAAYKVKKLSLSAAASTLTLGADNITVTDSLVNSGKIVYSGEGRITDNASTPKPINDVANSGTVEYTGSATTLTNFTSGNDYANLVVTSGLELTATQDVFVGGTATIADSVVLNGTQITFGGGVSIGAAGATFKANVVLNASKTMSAGNAATITFGGNFTNNGTYSSTGSKITFDGNFTNSGTFTDASAELTATSTSAVFSGNSITATSFKYSPATASGASLTLGNANTFTDFTATGLGGATITINAAQTVSGTLALSGTSETAPLTINGSGSIPLSSSQAGGQYLCVTGKPPVVPITGTGIEYAASDSWFLDGSDKKYGKDSGWVLLNSAMSFEWTAQNGSDKTAWAEEGNWNLGLVPGIENSIYSTKGYDVSIPAVTSNNYPKAAASYLVKNLTIGDGSITDSTAAAVPSVELSTADNIAVSGAFENYGKTIYSSDGRITNNAATPVPINDVGNKGTVLYSGATTLTDFGAVDYYNLIVNAGVALTGSTDIVVDNEAKIDGEASQITLFKVNGKTTIGSAGKIFTYGNQEYKGDVTNGGEIILGGLGGSTGNVSFGSNFTNNGTFTGSASTVTATGTAATFGGSTGITAKEFIYTPLDSTGTAAPDSAALTITTANTFTDFTATNLGGTTLKINANQTISGTLSLSGTSSKLFVIDGTGSFTILDDQTAGEFLSIKRNAVSILSSSSDKYFYALNSYFDSAVAEEKYGLHKNWIVLNDDAIFTWVGGTSGLWSNKDNWDFKLVPGLDKDIASGHLVDTRSYNVLIPIGCTNYPKTTVEYSIGNFTIGASSITDSIATDVYVELSSVNNLIIAPKTGTSTLKNYGKIIYSSSGRIFNNNAVPKPINDSANGGAVKYSGAATLITDFYTGTENDYANLEIATDVSNISVAPAVNIIVGGKTKIDSGVSVGANAFSFKGDVVEGGSGAATIIGDAYISGTKAASDIGAGTGSLVIDGDLHIAPSSSAKRTIASLLTVQKNILLYNGGVVVNADIKVPNGDAVLFGANYDANDNKEGTASSGQTGLFEYNHAARNDGKHAPVSYASTFPTHCPDGTAIPNGSAANKYGGALSVNTGATITVGKNFYANGIAVTGAGGWTLNIPDNKLQTSAFAEMYNSSITNCIVESSGTAFIAAAENCTVDPTCSGIYNSRPAIAEAYTVYDDVVKILFKDSKTGNPINIENSNNEISAAALRIIVGGQICEGTYIDADCTTSTDGKDNVSEFYIKAASKWNTDATGTNAGTAQSTNRSGAHCNSIPYINLQKALTGVYETLRDEHKNRIAQYYTATPNLSTPSSVAGKTFTDVEDYCAPVLIAVYTGQEMHKEDAAQQTDYDSHNFIEFQYSEPVTISDGLNEVADNAVNYQATANLGATTNNASGFTAAGLGEFSDGSIDASLKTGAGSPHSLYRKYSATPSGAEQNNNMRIRLSVAGYVDGVVNIAGKDYKNWAGYISSAAMPSGTVKSVATTVIKDRAVKSDSTPIANTLLSTDESAVLVNHKLVPIVVNAVPAGFANSALYGYWDTTPPSFAPMRVNSDSDFDWTHPPATDGSCYYEMLGVSYTGGMLSAIELHMFDNEPKYNSSDAYQWFSRIGWATVNASGEYDVIKSKAADIIGGSRPYDLPATTSGGIRYSSVYNANNSFEYATDLHSPVYKGISQNIQQGARSAYFSYIDAKDGAKNETDSSDGHFLKLFLDETGLTGETTFLVKFDSSTCYITDLAGNRIQCGNITMQSIDRTPPAFSISAAPLGTDKLLIVFSKELNVGNIEWYSAPNTSPITLPALEYIPKSLALSRKNNPHSPSETGIEIDENVPAKLLFKAKKSTGIVVSLKRNAVLNDVISDVFVTAKSTGTSYDPLSGTLGTVTYIQDEVGNYIREGRQHTFSDFAVNAVQMQYAYSLPKDIEASKRFDVEQGTVVIRNWDEGQGKNGCLTEDHEIVMQASLYDGTSDNSGGLDTSQIVTAYFGARPNASAVSSKINILMHPERKWRIWLPDLYENISYDAGVPDYSCDGDYISMPHSTDRQILNFDLPEDVVTEKWGDSDQVKFMFRLGDYTVDHNADGIYEPLYCLRLADSTDLSSLDLWSFRMKAVTLQRGGVTILNNVINVNEKQRTTVQVDMPSAGNLSVIVMTLDGSIVKYLQHGSAEKGLHYYFWDGTNNGGTPVARGLYFVRVIGSGIDETRKVMCIKK